MSKYVIILFCFITIPLQIAYGAPPDPLSPPKNETTTSSSAIASAQLLKQARRIERTTSRLRGLRLRRPLAMGVMNRQEIINLIKKRLEHDYDEKEIQIEARVLKQLGIIPQDLDYKAAILGVLQEQVAGFYDPNPHKLYLADWLPLSLQEPALSHEICHGLQDQHFRLKRLVKPIKDNGDRQLAQAALLEGDCTGVMIEYVLLPQGKDLGSMGDAIGLLAKAALTGGGGEKIQAAPTFIRETLLFPYLYGLTFVQKVRARSPWSAVNKIYQKLPESTEQLIHPDKYWTREHPILIRGTGLPSLQAYKLVKQDVIGEFQLSLYLGQALDSATAKRAAEGWGGDLLQAFQTDDPSMPLTIVHLSAWDSAMDAVEFVNAQRRVFEKQKLQPLPVPERNDNSWIYRNRQGSEWSVQLNDQQVLTLINVSPEIRPQLEQETWELWRVGGRKINLKRALHH